MRPVSVIISSAKQPVIVDANQQSKFVGAVTGEETAPTFSEREKAAKPLAPESVKMGRAPTREGDPTAPAPFERYVTAPGAPPEVEISTRVENLTWDHHRKSEYCRLLWGAG
jgi:hypothetical protein